MIVNTWKALLLIGIAVVAAAAFGGTTVTRRPGAWQKNGVVYPTEDDCLYSAKKELEAGGATVCSFHEMLVVQPTCEDVPAPPFEAELKTEACPNDDTAFRLTETYQASDDALWPVCWTVRERVVAECP